MAEASENQSSIKSVYSISWMHPILTSPWERLEASKKREGGKGLYLPGQIVISN